jgi:hypothetical protein
MFELRPTVRGLASRNTAYPKFFHLPKFLTAICLTLSIALTACGGKVSERACYDLYRRAFHCGTGLAWTDYQGSSLSRRDYENVPRLKLRYLYRF